MPFPCVLKCTHTCGRDKPLFYKMGGLTLACGLLSDGWTALSEPAQHRQGKTTWEETNLSNYDFMTL